jgi:hypothetical protein
MTATLVARLMLNLRAASTRMQVRVHTSSYSTAGRHISTLADVGKWISTPGTISESLFGMSDFDAAIGEGYDATASRGSGTGSSMTAVAQADAYERGRQLDIELQAFRPNTSALRDDG